MKIYDSHSDVFSNLAIRKRQNIENPFIKYHQKSLNEGQIAGGIFVVYSDYEFDVKKELQVALVEYKEFKNDYDVIIGLEGLRNVKTLKDFKDLYDMGVRHASLTWNEGNHLASGAKSEVSTGVTKQGFEFIDFMNEHDMIVDVSHLDEKSFYDVINYKPKILVASHSNAYSLCNHVRNLKDEQLIALKNAGGVVGVVSAGNFVSSIQEEKTVKKLVEHIVSIINLIGEDHVMLGLDMMDFLDDFNNANLIDLASHKDAQNIVEEMKKANLSVKTIEKVCYKNFEKIKKLVK